MCLILFAYRQHADHPLILIANRDEYYARPARAAHWWDDADIFGGRDLEAGGTWLGLDRRGRLAAVTNVREPGNPGPGSRSRGELTRNFLAGSIGAEAYLRQLNTRGREYAGFNLLLGEPDKLWFYSNREHRIRSIEPGVYGISNGAFDESWPKLDSGKAELTDLLAGSIDATGLMNILADRSIAEDHELPSTGVPLDVERMLSSRFVRSPEYGTRACSAVIYDSNERIRFYERNYVDGEPGKRIEASFEVTPA